ncbi:hypothetical protein WJX81_003842 [Elliptochloris bilobata]|uniref:Uncharacterized protein n=1 Tax=Elliptochloris bilobata TaxID=381761 RepID=A0AAW1SJ48_9CHLO
MVEPVPQEWYGKQARRRVPLHTVEPAGVKAVQEHRRYVLNKQPDVIALQQVVDPIILASGEPLIASAPAIKARSKDWIKRTRLLGNWHALIIRLRVFNSECGADDGVVLPKELAAPEADEVQGGGTATGEASGDDTAQADPQAIDDPGEAAQAAATFYAGFVPGAPHLLLDDRMVLSQVLSQLCFRLWLEAGEAAVQHVHAGLPLVALVEDLDLCAEERRQAERQFEEHIFTAAQVPVPSSTATQGERADALSGLLQAIQAGRTEMVVQRVRVERVGCNDPREDLQGQQKLVVLEDVPAWTVLGPYRARLCTEQEYTELCHTKPANFLGTEQEWLILLQAYDALACLDLGCVPVKMGRKTVGNLPACTLSAACYGNQTALINDPWKDPFRFGFWQYAMVLTTTAVSAGHELLYDYLQPYWLNLRGHMLPVERQLRKSAQANLASERERCQQADQMETLLTVTGRTACLAVVERALSALRQSWRRSVRRARRDR